MAAIGAVVTSGGSVLASMVDSRLSLGVALVGTGAAGTVVGAALVERDRSLFGTVLGIASYCGGAAAMGVGVALVGDSRLLLSAAAVVAVTAVVVLWVSTITEGMRLAWAGLLGLAVAVAGAGAGAISGGMAWIGGGRPLLGAAAIGAGLASAVAAAVAIRFGVLFASGRLLSDVVP